MGQRMIFKYRNSLDYNAYYNKAEKEARMKAQLKSLLDMVFDQIRPGHMYVMVLDEENSIVDNEITYCKTLSLEVEEMKLC